VTSSSFLSFDGERVIRQITSMVSFLMPNPARPSEWRNGYATSESSNFACPKNLCQAWQTLTPSLGYEIPQQQAGFRLSNVERGQFQKIDRRDISILNKPNFSHPVWRRFFRSPEK